MGEVYRARDAKLGRDIAVKVLPQATASDPDRRQRFELEARSASALNHPNILTIYDIGEADGSLYIAMELIEGRTLRELVASGEPLPTKRLLDYAVQTAEGLAKAHAAGIVHRDLKPENLMVTKDGFVKILDFGLAKLTEPVSQDASILPTAIAAPTQPGTVMGTAGYMSPEQASGQSVDYRSDQFTLGAILYEMATGKRAFQRKTGAETLVAIIKEEPEPISQAAPKAPAPVRWIVERLLAKDPEERYASSKDLARDLKSVRDHLTETSLSGGLEAAGPVKARRRGWALPALAALVDRDRRGIPAAQPHRRQNGAATRNEAPDLLARRHPHRSLRSRRADDRLRRRVGRAAPRNLLDAGGQFRVALARAPERRRARRSRPLASSRSRFIAATCSASNRSERSRACHSRAARRARSSKTWRTPTGRPTGRASP